MQFSSFIIVGGHYGSGKTNFSLNLASVLRRRGKAVTLVDMDIVNPYFRSSDYRRGLEDAGIRLIAPTYAGTTLDTPALPPEISSVFDAPEGHVIFDVGGDDAGATALGCFSNRLDKVDYEFLYVVNQKRNLTATAQEAAEILKEIECASHLRVTGLVNNTHLCDLTDVQTVEDSLPYGLEVSRLTGVPVKLTAADKRLCDGISRFAGELFPVEILVKPDFSF